MRLAGKVIVVTGAGGIAVAAARRISAEGASVFLISLDAEECARAIDGLKSADYHAADLRQESATLEAFAMARERFGRVDGLVAAAGGSGRHLGDGPVHEVSKDGWSATQDLNLTTTFLSVREAAKAMLDQGYGGSIVIIGSVLSDHPAPEYFATHSYAAAKGAQIALARAMAAYYAHQRIRVNAVAPGLTDTPMAQRALSDPEIGAFVAARQPLLGGPVMPSQVAELTLFLLSDESTAVTGQVIAVDGGWGLR